MINALLAAALAVTLLWTDNSDNEEGFKIYRQLPGAAFELLTTMPLNGNSVRDEASSPGVCYRVTAYNSAGESAPSNTACVLTVPNAPVGLAIKIDVSVTIGGPTP